ncbi:LamG-like jellyroll fold domain-containing protein [uncultured Shewanella sp.]|uniref:LamG-like jellyroll fold domain-containing protein n=1 Tax=uncultured Shewanella sp. TaxID=173975 RepID=UPI002610D4A5|nr:LamG-like jellyroll fold domain-containing protein [uncultured Shewanella sp.]
MLVKLGFKLITSHQFHLFLVSVSFILLLSYQSKSFAEVKAETDVNQWQAMDIGNANYPGSHVIDNEQLITIQGSGNDIWNNQDDFYFLYKNITGNATIITKVHSIENTHPWAKAAIMFRETLASDSVNVALDYSAHEHIAFQWRPVANNRSYYWGKNVGTGPVWLKLQREGNLFTGYYSFDGENWLQTTSKTVPMGESYYVGLAASPHVTTSNAEAIFSNVDVLQDYNDKAKVYLMAGQSNMEGYGANSGLAATSGADLTGTRDDVFIQNIISNTRGLSGLQPGFGSRSSHFGVELKMGNVLGNVLAEDIYLFKGAKGGTTLDNTAHWRPQAFGGESGNLYEQLITGFNAFLQNELIANNIDYELAGFIWFQGYNDTFGSELLYENHLTNLISAVRQDLNRADLPVIITQINDNRGLAGDIVMAAQANVANNDPLAALVYTGDQRPYYHYGSDSYVVIGERIAQACLPLLNYATALKDSYTLSPNTVLNINTLQGVLTNDKNASVAELTQNVTNGSLMLNLDGSFQYTPNANFKGRDRFTYATKHNGRLGNSVKVDLWVRESSDPLVLHYTFDNNNASPILDSASGIPAYIAKTGITFEHSGAINTAAYFDGNTVLHYLSEYPVYDFLDLNTDNDFSLSAWVKPDSGVISEQIIISNKYYYNSRSGFALTLANNGTGLKAYVGSYDHINHTSKAKSFIAGNVNLTDGQWHHVAATFGFSNNQLSIYIDGLLAGQTNLTGLVGDINKYESAIGDGSGGGDGKSNAYQGYMDDLRLYQKALSDTEVAQLYAR